MQKLTNVILVLAMPVIALALCLLAYQGARAHAVPKLTTPYQAVLLANGQAFFGRIENLDSAYPVLSEVYYIQSRTNAETKQVSNVMVKRGSEWHGPDRMILNKQTVILIEPVKEDSQVAKLIAEQSKAR